MVVRLFGWVNLLAPATALKVWMAVLMAAVVAATLAALQTRRALGLSPVPAALAVAAVGYSMPAVSALERGQVEPVTVLALLAAAWLLRSRHPWRDVAAGALLGVTAWVKYYPGAALLGLLALRRGKATVAFVLVAGLIGVIDRVEVMKSIRTGRLLAQSREARYRPVHPLSHSIPGEWRHLWAVKPVGPLRRLPGPVAAVLVLGPAVAMVARRVARAGGDPRLTDPFFLWLTAAATFAMPYSNDYNLVILLPAAVAVWDRGDPSWVHVVLGLSTVCLQPLALPVSSAVFGQVSFTVKLAALFAVGASLALRAHGWAARTSAVVAGTHEALAALSGESASLVSPARHRP
jgi:hypothetical protein